VFPEDAGFIPTTSKVSSLSSTCYFPCKTFYVAIPLL
jgi:hypothetical protein